MIKLKELFIMESPEQLKSLPQGKLLINTINAHSYNTALKDPLFFFVFVKDAKRVSQNCIKTA